MILFHLLGAGAKLRYFVPPVGELRGEAVQIVLCVPEVLSARLQDVPDALAFGRYAETHELTLQ